MLSRWSRMVGLVRGHRRRLFLLLVRGRHLSRVFFSRDAHTKKKRGRPRKAARGRSRQKGSLTKRGGASTTRQLFKEGELGENLRASPGGGGAVDSQSTPLGAPGISAPFLPIVAMHGEGDPTPIMVGIGTTQGICHTTQLVGMSSTYVPLLDVPEFGHSSGPGGPSDSFIAKKVLSGGKEMGVDFKVRDLVEESRLVALEVRDGAAKAAMSVNTGVP